MLPSRPSFRLIQSMGLIGVASKAWPKKAISSPLATRGVGTLRAITLHGTARSWQPSKSKQQLLSNRHPRAQHQALAQLLRAARSIHCPIHNEASIPTLPRSAAPLRTGLMLLVKSLRVYADTWGAMRVFLHQAHALVRLPRGAWEA